MSNYVDRIKRYHDEKRSNYLDLLLMYYFKSIRYQCKWEDRQIDTLLEYINELEYRGLRYRL